jgi:hypothetical protein
MPEPFLSEKTTTLLLGLLGGAISGLSAQYFAPWFKWKLDLRKEEINRSFEEKENRRKMIRQWREMLRQASMFARSDEVNPGSILQRDTDYLTLEPFLSPEAKASVYMPIRTIVIGSEFQGCLLILKEEISRIESSWGLLK